jgi:hypothetical protein
VNRSRRLQSRVTSSMNLHHPALDITIHNVAINTSSGTSSLESKAPGIARYNAVQLLRSRSNGMGSVEFQAGSIYIACEVFAIRA